MAEYELPSDAVSDTEIPQWETTVYLASQTGYAVGGKYTVPTNLHPATGMPVGNYNLPHQQLRNRTAWLKAQVDSLQIATAPRAPMVFATPGEFDSEVPVGATLLEYELWGAGGGGSATTVSEYGEGGGGGGYRRGAIPVVAGQTYSVVVGAGGDGVVIDVGPAGDGGDTALTYGGTTLTAGGGHGAHSINSGGGSPGAGGICSGGTDVKINGQDGEDSAGNFYYGVGGGAACGGHGGVVGASVGPGQAPGGGGSGGRQSASAGAHGMAVLRFR